MRNRMKFSSPLLLSLAGLLTACGVIVTHAQTAQAAAQAICRFSRECDPDPCGFGPNDYCTIIDTASDDEDGSICRCRTVYPTAQDPNS